MTTHLLLAAACLLGPPVAAEPPPPADGFRPDPSWKKLAEDVWFDPAAEDRRLILRARVALQEGFLEHLLCLSRTKEHESVLATSAPPRMIHAGLLLTGAEKGHPAVFRPDFKPPAGTPIAIEVRWTDVKGVARSADARTWVRDLKTGKTLEPHWVFAGSDEFIDPQTGDRIYAADGGDLITVSNFIGAILDVPFASSADDLNRSFEANTPAIPPPGTPVTIILKPTSVPSKPTEPRP